MQHTRRSRAFRRAPHKHRRIFGPRLRLVTVSPAARERNHLAPVLPHAHRRAEFATTGEVLFKSCTQSFDIHRSDKNEVRAPLSNCAHKNNRVIFLTADISATYQHANTDVLRKLRPGHPAPLKLIQHHLPMLARRPHATGHIHFQYLLRSHFHRLRNAYAIYDTPYSTVPRVTLTDYQTPAEFAQASLSCENCSAKIITASLVNIGYREFPSHLWLLCQISKCRFDLFPPPDTTWESKRAHRPLSWDCLCLYFQSLQHPTNGYKLSFPP